MNLSLKKHLCGNPVYLLVFVFRYPLDPPSDITERRGMMQITPWPLKFQFLTHLCVFYVSCRPWIRITCFHQKKAVISSLRPCRRRTSTPPRITPPLWANTTTHRWILPAVTCTADGHTRKYLVINAYLCDRGYTSVSYHADAFEYARIYSTGKPSVRPG